MLRLVSSSILATALCLGSSLVAALPFSDLYAVGDSLSDGGNALILVGGNTSAPPYNPVPSLPYASGRFSDGPVWIEQLAATLGLPALAPSFAGGNNFAIGGARVGPAAGGASSSLLDQSSRLLFANGSVLDPDALYSIWGGGNDIRDAGVVAAGGGSPVPMLTEATNGINSIIRSLAASGARQFLVPNAPDLGLTPEAQAGGPAVAAGASFLSVLFNSMLDGVLNAIEADIAGVQIARLDIFGLMHEVSDNPGSFGLTEATAPCLRFGVSDPAGAVCANPDQYLFWDGIHPTSAMHGIIAARAGQALGIPEPATLLLFALGLTGLAIGRRRVS